NSLTSASTWLPLGAKRPGGSAPGGPPRVGGAVQAAGGGRGGRLGRVRPLGLHGAPGGLPRGGVAAVGVGGLQRVVDELAERRVALGDADAVGLLGEGLVDQLERALAGADQAGEDDVVGGDGLDLAVAQC